MGSVTILISVLTGLCLTWATVAALRAHRTYSVFLGSLLVFHLSGTFEGTYDGILIDEVLLRGQLYVLAGTLFLIFTIRFLEKGKLNPGNPCPPGDNRRLTTRESKYLWFAIACVAGSFFIRARNGFDFLTTVWQTARDETNLLDGVANFLTVLAAPAAWIALRSWSPVRFILVIGGVLMSVVVTGARSLFLVFVCMVFYCLVLLQRNWRQQLVYMLMLILLAFTAHTSLRIVRGQGFVGFYDLVVRGDLGVLGDEADAIGISQVLTGGESTIYRYYYDTISSISTVPSYMEGRTIVRLLLFLVPGSLTGDFKPRDVTYDVWAYFVEKGLYGNEVSSLELQRLFATGQWGCVHFLYWGDAVLNLGPFGVVLYGILGGVALVLFERFINRMMWPMNGILACLAMLGYMAAARGAIVNGVGYAIYPIMLSWPVLWFIGLWKTNAIATNEDPACLRNPA